MIRGGHLGRPSALQLLWFKIAKEPLGKAGPALPHLSDEAGLGSGWEGQESATERFPQASQLALGVGEGCKAHREKWGPSPSL